MAPTDRKRHATYFPTTPATGTITDAADQIALVLEGAGGEVGDVAVPTVREDAPLGHAQVPGVVRGVVRCACHAVGVLADDRLQRLDGVRPQERTTTTPGVAATVGALTRYAASAPALPDFRCPSQVRAGSRMHIGSIAHDLHHCACIPPENDQSGSDCDG